MKKDVKKKVFFVCSGGGHLTEMLQLHELFEKYDYLLITEKNAVAASLKETYNVRFLMPRSKGQKRQFLFFTTLIVNFFLSVGLLFKHYPKVIITTGSHTAVPMCLLGKLMGIKVVFILTYARVNTRALTADILYHFADQFILQWPEAKTNYEKGIYLGGIY